MGAAPVNSRITFPSSWKPFTEIYTACSMSLAR